jgi:hypothetical protein
LEWIGTGQEYTDLAAHFARAQRSPNSANTHCSLVGTPLPFSFCNFPFQERSHHRKPD